ncbi:D-alanyl-D-alanine carboxypeptidase [Thermomonospora cellulosilytica]|uniref:Uncharacterized protein n=1 Tax=Thermomonospora cellulosilytica TaxID=1411118 RepID=A0A7W3N1D9_9ACTN|nr:D-alanyl-D-alanine carboxypeptidase [Thermomonospora cellulosilytica]MBA9005727.1 hypothetical protein [Thermomonospora cellulosilytica]
MAIKARVLATVTRLIAVLLVPIAFCLAPGRARFLACQWALGLRFPAEDLRGLTPETLAAFTHARAEAFWRDGQLIGLTYDNEWWHFEYRTVEPIRLPHPAAAAWLCEHGAAYGLCRIYDNEPWHDELRPDAVDDGRPPMYADPAENPRTQP